jgi:8-amino-7-oxononanoate synthase
MQRKVLAGLTGAARDKLLASARAMRKLDKVRHGEREPRGAGRGPGSFDFATLSGYRQLMIHRAAADMLNIDSPFFRSHEVRASAHTVIGGKRYLNFASYDYCGLNGHPEVNAAAMAAIERFGTSVSASRIVSGERPVHQDLEKAIAGFLGVEDAVVMVSGHATNVTVIGHLLGPDDLILTDSLIHNSITEGARLSGANRLTFAHNDVDQLGALLADNRHRYERVLIAVEGLYSMDGDYPRLDQIIRMKDRHDAWLLVDEAHALGVLGATGHGIAEELGVDPRSVEIWMGTLSKTLSACGGFIAGSTALCEYLKATAPGFVFSVGMPAASAAAALACLRILEREPERVARLRENGQRFVERARARGLDTGTSSGFAIVPVITGDSILAGVLSHQLFVKGLNVLPIIYPAVPEKTARLRFFITSEHTASDIDEAVDLTADSMAEARAQGEGLARLAKQWMT